MNSINIICVALLFVVCSSAKNIHYNIFGGQHDNLRVVNGEDASPGQFPHQVSLRGMSGSHFCGASIINSRWILSAAHCAQNENAVPSFVTATVGTINRLNGGKTYTLSHIIANPAYDAGRLSNDVSLLRTQAEIQFTEYVQPITLPTSNLPANTKVTVSGWGRTSYPPKPDEPQLPETLQFMSGHSLSRKECMKHFAKTYFDNFITDTVVCAYNPGRGACHGDSGGPLMTDENILVGIVSWGIPCARDFPDVYTRVYSFLDFIHGQIGQEYEN